MSTEPNRATRKRRPDGEATRAVILKTALRLFRKRGFDRTTMRDIAIASKMSLGAAYHYFASKEAIVLAYYEDVSSTLSDEVDARLETAKGFRERTRVVLSTRLEGVRKDRDLMVALVRIIVDPTSPLSPLSVQTSAIRERTMKQFARALENEELPAAVAEPLASTLFIVHLALLLHLIHDRSEGQWRTMRIVDDLVDFVADALPIFATPMGAMLLARALPLLEHVSALADASTSRRPPG